MTRFYAKELGPTLSEAVSKFLDTPVPQQQLALWDELAIMRHTATHACEMYREACEGKDKLRKALETVLARDAPDEDLVGKLEAALVKADESLASAVTYMRDACKEVADVAGKAARVEAQVQASAGVITPAQVGLVVDQVLRCAQDAFGERRTDDLKRFEELVRQNVKMPSSGAQGTSLTPDQDVRAMHATIPAPPSDEDEEGDE